MRPPNSGRCCVEGRPAHIAACCFHEKHLQARTMPHSHNEPGCMNNLSRLSLSDMKIAQIQQKLSCLAFQYFAKKTNLLILLYHSAIASAWWYLESEIQILEWFACRTCHSTHGWEHWRNRLKTAVKAFCLVLGLFCLSFFPPFLYVYSLSLSLSPTKPFPSHGLTLLVYNCLSRPKDLAMCNVQSKAEMGTHALHAPQRICKACKEKKCELEKMQGQHFKRIRCEGKKMWKKVSQRNSLTQLYQCKGITHLNRCNRCSNCFNSSMFWARKAIYTKHLREEGVRFVACIEVNSNPSLLLSWF